MVVSFKIVDMILVMTLNYIDLGVIGLKTRKIRDFTYVSLYYKKEKTGNVI